MKTALRKDQTRRPRVKSKRVSKSVKKAAPKPALDEALKLYAEFHRDKARTKLRNKVNTNDSIEISTKGIIKVSRASGNCSSGDQNSQHIPTYKVSVCPVKRPVSAIEMGMINQCDS